jgi:predicted DNA-binding transcriptional regulator AlpA
VGWGPREIEPKEGSWWQTVLEHGGPNHPALVSGPEIARALGRKPQTIRKLRMLGKLPPPVVVSGRLRWWRRDIQAWMLARRLDPSALSKVKDPDVLPATDTATQ